MFPSKREIFLVFLVFFFPVVVVVVVVVVVCVSVLMLFYTVFLPFIHCRSLGHSFRPSNNVCSRHCDWRITWYWPCARYDSRQGHERPRRCQVRKLPDSC